MTDTVYITGKKLRVQDVESKSYHTSKCANLARANEYREVELSEIPEHFSECQTCANNPQNTGKREINTLLRDSDPDELF